MTIDVPAAGGVSSGHTVLLVDDSATNLQILVRTLEGRGHQLLVARGGRAALEIARRAKPDLVLLDVMMPDLDGYETCRAIRTDPALQQTAVIFLSALGEVADRVAGLEMGAVDFISKPFQAEEVIARVDSHLATQRLQRELRASRDKLDRELASAAEMQRLLLPRKLPQCSGVRFAARYQTSRHAGGDYYDVIPLPDSRCGILIADVAGHGAPAAIVMAMIRAVLHAHPGPPCDPPEVLRWIHRHFGFLADTPLYATALYAVIDPQELRVRMSCAAHPPPLLRRGGRAGELAIDAVTPLLWGELGDVPCVEHMLEPGDRLLFYTDGVIERQDETGAMFDVERLAETLAGPPGEDPEHVLDRITAELERFAHQREAVDDHTLLLLSLDPR